LQILATELGDETFIIAAIMSMQHPRLVVYAGAMTALIFMTVMSSTLPDLWAVAENAVIIQPDTNGNGNVEHSYGKSYSTQAFQKP